MNKYTLLIVFIALSVCMQAQNFTDYFSNHTLRLDYLFTGNADRQEICLDELSQLPGWAGRKHHLDELPLHGNGQIIVKDENSKKVIYKTSFSSLFQEWLETDEAKVSTRGFENTFLVPFPTHPAEIEVILYDSRRNIRTQMTHRIDPKDVLIHKKGYTHITPHKYLLKSKTGDVSTCIDVAILAEGYRKDEMHIFEADAKKACESLLNHAPFSAMKEKGGINIIAVFSPSEDSGVSIPRLNAWKNTAFNSHFSTFYSDRYLTTSRLKAVHDALAGIPYEHIIILANTEEYGGGGIYNSYTLTTAHHPLFQQVVVHEFGHSFAGLADEYFYDNDVMTDTYPLDVEPWEQNITTQICFSQKWKDMIAPTTPVPTNPADSEKYAVGLFEGGGYSAKGIYRPANDCRMRTNEYPAFCPVCQRAIQRVIDFYTKP